MKRKIWVYDEQCGLAGQLIGNPDQYLSVDVDGDPELSADVYEIVGTDSELLARADKLMDTDPLTSFRLNLSRSIRESIDKNIDYTSNWDNHVKSCEEARK